MPLLTKPLSSYAIVETEEDRRITAFGGHLVSVAGPYLYPISVLTRKLMHKLYVIDSPSPFIAGFDLVVAAHLIICLLYTSPSPRDRTRSRMPSSA